MEFDELPWYMYRSPSSRLCHPSLRRPARSAGRRSEGSRIGAATHRRDPSLRRERLAAAPGSAQDDTRGAAGGWRVYRVNSSNSISRRADNGKPAEAGWGTELTPRRWVSPPGVCPAALAPGTRRDPGSVTPPSPGARASGPHPRSNSHHGDRSLSLGHKNGAQKRDPDEPRGFRRHPAGLSHSGFPHRIPVWPVPTTASSLPLMRSTSPVSRFGLELPHRLADLEVRRPFEQLLGTA